MNGDNKVDRMLGELERTLAAYGADPVRWPKHQRSELTALSVSDPRAVKMCEEAAALDSLLDVSREVTAPASVALMSRIMREATADQNGLGSQGTPSAGNKSADVVPIAPALQRSQDLSSGAGGGSDQSVRESRTGGRWASVAMLAASLMLGIYIGGSGQLSSALEQTGLFDDQQVVIGQTVFLDPVSELDEAVGEDLL